MLTARVSVQYDGDWTAEVAKHDVFGEFIASTFRNNRYVGMLAIESQDCDAVRKIISSHETVETIDLVEQYETSEGRCAATMLLRGRLNEVTPLQALMYDGYLPLGPTQLINGRECFDLLLDDRDELSKAIDLLSDFGSVRVERITQDFRREIIPSRSEWQELLSSIPPRQREILNTAVERGYFEIPRQVTLEEIAEEMDITKTTASNHLRKVEQQLIKFVLPYINLAVQNED
ncbi:helix-turn-helix domain-containing protein [Natronococcus jeotgali]|uniref:Bacterio-opsin activator-like protein n=1 Tax=Natronococcus jeotgali DSM 18795 TaxID=1227498 RepID=L9XJG4_9EURY|nr:helix-turn-helix domain-containing protein [Natronococcus jeotgali]ELY61541.1 bacterio-opsin activator-like protein [Natronococcus jeotgali DSM 18795]